MNSKLLLLIMIASFSFNPANADVVNESAVTSFEDGTPAIADEVNANFQALISAINDNATRLAALETNAGSSNSVAGKTYQLNQIGIINRGDGENYSSTANLSQQYTLTFDNNMTFQLFGAESEAELNTDINVLTLLGENVPVDVSNSYAQNGNSITINVGATETTTFTVSADGNILILSEFGFSDFDEALESESSLVIGIRIE